jgi:hypothetical protein
MKVPHYLRKGFVIPHRGMLPNAHFVLGDCFLAFFARGAAGFGKLWRFVVVVVVATREREVETKKERE